MAGLGLQDERGFNQVFAPVGSTPLRMRRRNDWFLERAREFGARRVLEIGCGLGDAAAYLAAGLEGEVVAVDLSEAFIGQARERHGAANLRFEALDLLGENALSLGTFDMVFGNGILHHLVVRLPEVLAGLRKLTNPGGGMAFIEPNFRNPSCAVIFGTAWGRRLAKLEPDEMAFTRGELQTALAQANWSDIRVDTRDFLVPGLPVSLIPPILAIEPALEAAAATRWLAQSHFIVGRARP